MLSKVSPQQYQGVRPTGGAVLKHLSKKLLVINFNEHTVSMFVINWDLYNYHKHQGSQTVRPYYT
jgi:hypothetical protein